MGEDCWWPAFWTEGGAVELRFACGGMAKHDLRFGGRRRQSMLGFSDSAFMFFFFFFGFYL